MFNQPNFGVSIPIYNPVTIMNPFERYQTPQVPYSGYYIPNFSYCQTFGTNLPTNEK